MQTGEGCRKVEFGVELGEARIRMESGEWDMGKDWIESGEWDMG